MSSKQKKGFIFSNGKTHKTVYTVKELIKELSLIDGDIPVNASFTTGVDVVVFNRNQPDIQVCFEDAGQWDDEEGNDE